MESRCGVDNVLIDHYQHSCSSFELRVPQGYDKAFHSLKNQWVVCVVVRDVTNISCSLCFLFPADWKASKRPKLGRNKSTTICSINHREARKTPTRPWTESDNWGVTQSSDIWRSMLVEFLSFSSCQLRSLLIQIYECLIVQITQKVVVSTSERCKWFTLKRRKYNLGLH